ncbi:RDD family protein [Novipirellula artificiosorum]|uniref:RDD family protein n=1 Tax=Novipirellula artificiosorum TaxID=2528016 RepID=A0A5C6CW94_9BACT|nr:RDD family protein [Novipirellula artificiosorum]TWU27984.1 RDD family protein [Novipirellula artificiosorum]
MTTDHSLGNGVYYDINDYPGFLRRLAVFMIDSLVLVVIGILLWMVIASFSIANNAPYDPSGIFYLVWIVAVWIYLVPLKRSRVRTIAYRLLSLKIVTTRGERPSLFTMTFRMLMWMFGPFNLVIDLIWLGADTEQQSLRDCYVGTYVVRNTAEPIGEGPMHLTRYNAAGFSISYPRAGRQQSAPQ